MPTLQTHSEAPHSDPFTFTTDLSLGNGDSTTTEETLTTADKSAYLAHLRAAVADHQARVNEALTARMEADKIRDPSSAPSATTEPTSTKNKKRKKNNGNGTETPQTQAIADEDAEEQNYGEEVVEDDDEV
ncbi:hypothetical protein PG993_008572 [Apiospora rasikravindrae]|uniref:EKC/KEOPS complex subunit GON7 n=1 Tax=Apiospora rasikravindrae TaxID=990691 RepID=A0ABR1T278_9PEZI